MPGRFKNLAERIEWEKTVGKDARLSRYRNLAHIDESFVITEENIDKDIFSQVCVESGCNPHMFKAQLLGKDDEYWSQD